MCETQPLKPPLKVPSGFMYLESFMGSCELGNQDGVLRTVTRRMAHGKRVGGMRIARETRERTRIWEAFFISVFRVFRGQNFSWLCGRGDWDGRAPRIQSLMRVSSVAEGFSFLKS